MLQEIIPGAHWLALLAAWYGAASIAAFAAYALDKSAARRHARRVAESTLHLLALAGGWPGAALAQSLLRHKTRKQPFRSLWWLSVALNCTALAILLALAAR